MADRLDPRELWRKQPKAEKAAARASGDAWYAVMQQYGDPDAAGLSGRGVDVLQQARDADDRLIAYWKARALKAERRGERPRADERRRRGPALATKRGPRPS